MHGNTNIKLFQGFHHGSKRGKHWPRTLIEIVFGVCSETNENGGQILHLCLVSGATEAKSANENRVGGAERREEMFGVAER